MRPSRPAGSSSRAAQPPLQAGTHPNPKLSVPNAHGTSKRARNTVRWHTPQRAATLGSGTIKSQAPARQQPLEELVSSPPLDSGAADSASAGDDTVMVTFRFPGALEGQEVSVIGERRACSQCRTHRKPLGMHVSGFCCRSRTETLFNLTSRAQARSPNGRSPSRCEGRRRRMTL